MKYKVLTALFTIIAALTVIFALGPREFYVYGYDETTEDGKFTYETQQVDDVNKINIVRYNGNDENVIIPNEINGNPVDTVSAAFENNSQIHSVIIPEGIKSIYGTFNGCINLTNVELPDSLDTIGEKTFMKCENLTEIVIPNSVRYMYSSFGGCKSLKSVTFPEQMSIDTDSLFAECKSLEKVTLPRIVEISFSIIGSQFIYNDIGYIGENCFRNCESLKEIIIPDGVEEIYEHAFDSCINLEKVTFPDTLTQIGSNAFSNCGLKSITLPKNTELIEKNAFESCSSLEKVIFAEGFKNIGNNAFKNCNSLTEIVFSDTVENIGNNAFQFCNSLKKVTFAKGIKTIGKEAFDGCSSLETIEILSPQAEIGESSFNECPMLKNIKIADGVKAIGQNAFRMCSSLEKIQLPASLTFIDNSAFAGCKNLKSADLSNVMSINDTAFNFCDNLTYVKLNLKAEISENAFINCPKFHKINNEDVTMINSETERPYFNPKLKDFVMKNFIYADNVGFINDFIENEARFIARDITDDSMSDIEKAIILHDWILNHTEYDYENEYPKRNYTDTSVFFNGKSICAGYARAYHLLLKGVGIESYYVNGYANTANIAHAWNIIKLGNHYFQSDTCWDDTASDSDYKYFLMSDKQSGESRWGTKLSFPSELYKYDDKLPVCEYSVGDINMDGQVNISDIVQLQKHIVNKEQIIDGDLVLSDLTHDGKINVFDMVMLRRCILNG